jgi:hypothetical protein
MMATTDIYVGYHEKSKNFNTIQEAIDEAASINPQKE